MGDFLLDFRRRHRCTHAEPLRFFRDMAVDSIVRKEFALFVSRADSERLWAPFEAEDGTLVALAGRVALEPAEWDAAARVGGPGGLACKAIYRSYRDRGLSALHELSGGFALHVHDPRRNTYYLVTDRGGAYPCYAPTVSDELVCSHPDVLASTLATPARAGEAHGAWDLVSMAQFISTGVVSFPFSYYRSVGVLDFGSVHSFALQAELPVRRSAQRYANRDVEQLSEESEELIAQRLAEAISAAARRRTAPILGCTAVALSGGLDSRTILCAATRHSELFAFCAFDERNAEFRYAKAIADALGVRLVPFERGFDHYGDHAEMGVRISGGMGEIASNHFLGFRDRLRQLGADNLVTGCYFDYLFKSLALDAREEGLLRTERFAAFSLQTYLPHFPVGAKFRQPLEARLAALFPEADRRRADPETRARNAMRRIFPLYHEGDNAQRLIPLRVMGWYAPSLDREVLELCRTTPPGMKLNKRVFRKAVQKVCGPALSRIPDNNTGLPVDAPAWRVALSRYRIGARRAFERRRRRLGTAESWPNWAHYVRTSGKLRELWLRPNEMARELIGELCGEPFREDVADYAGRPTQYFLRLLTLKLWLDQRTIN